MFECCSRWVSFAYLVIRCRNIHLIDGLNNLHELLKRFLYVRNLIHELYVLSSRYLQRRSRSDVLDLFRGLFCGRDGINQLLELSRRQILSGLRVVDLLELRCRSVFVYDLDDVHCLFSGLHRCSWVAIVHLVQLWPVLFGFGVNSMLDLCGRYLYRHFRIVYLVHSLCCWILRVKYCGDLV
jgi:hypothetical protein